MSVDRATWRPCAFVTCSTRAHASLKRLVAEVEQQLLDLGYRTRVRRRTAAAEVENLAERRRLRAQAYQDVERATVVVHVPAGASKAGEELHRELAHAVRMGIPVVVVVGAEARDRHGIEPPSLKRLHELSESAGARIVREVADLGGILEVLRKR